MSSFFRMFRKISGKVQQDDGLKDALREKYLAFQKLLTENNNVLKLMADMEEKLSGEYLFDRHYIRTNAAALSDGVLKIIEYINVISYNRYAQLHAIYADIRTEIEAILARGPDVPVSDLVIPIEKLAGETAHAVGGKMAHLGEIKNRLGLLTPEGFAISAYAFRRFMEHNNLIGTINDLLASMRIDSLDELDRTSKQIQEMIISAEVPEDLRSAVSEALENLRPRVMAAAGKEVMVSVRSSALHEDGEFSFAGQYATFLNVPSGSVVPKYKEVVASLFTPRALFYCKTKGFSEEDMVMAVGVLEMIDAKAGGVMYTHDPNDPGNGTVIINALWGLGKPVVDGTAAPHSYIVARETGAVLEQKIPGQHAMLVCTPGGDVGEVGLRDGMEGKPCLTGTQVKMLLEHALALEKHYGKPQDVEWAIDRDVRVCILQSRPLRTFSPRHPASGMPRKAEGYTVLIEKGVIACKGIGCGAAFVLKNEEDLKDFPEGAVLVARHTSTRFVTVMDKASAIITDVGGATGHMASLAREYGVPTILDTGTATGVIKNGQELTVDAFNCNVYAGRVDELLAHAPREEEPFKKTRLFITLERVLKLIVPLNLIDPDADNFKPESCRTFHDITRFVHEMAMAEIFKTGKGQPIDSFEDLMSAVALAESGAAKRLGPQTCALIAGIPIDAHLLDIDEGIRGTSKKVTPDDIVSIPFSSFLRGLMSMRWPEPRPFDAGGFLGMIAHTASIPEEQLHKIGGKSYAIVSRNYMNFSIRLGYHFSMVEAYAGENMNDNYIKFFFKGGGAATDRRLRRVRLIKEILRKMDFRVSVTEDVIDAILTKYSQSMTGEKLEVMGKLTVYTKQLDMAMYNDAITDMFIEDFIGEHLR